MFSLYIDTHMNIVTIVLYKDGKVVIKKEKESNLSHSVIVMPLIVETLKEADITKDELNEIICVNGPGSFTGVRIGVTIAKTLAYCLNIPCKSLTSLEVKAFSSDYEEKLVVVNEKNGKFIGRFNKDNELIDKYRYLSIREYEKYIIDKNRLVVDRIEIDYEKIFRYILKKEYTLVHNLNPLYIKDLEV